MAGDDYAMVVGIAHYPSISDLKGPENDAGHFHEWLIAPDGGAVPKDQAFLVLSSDYPSAATRMDARPISQDINNKFERMIDKGKSNNGRTGRRLYIFLAGHGCSPGLGLEESALFMANAGSGYWGYHIPGRCYASWFIASAFFDEVVLLMDCCRDQYPQLRTVSPPWDPIIQARAYKVSRLYGFATKWSRKSREKVIDGGEVRGLFSLALLKGLQREARDEQGRITGRSLKGFVYNFLPKLLSSDQYQEPAFEGDEDIVFAEGIPPELTTARINFGQLDENAVVEIIGPLLQPLGQHLPKDGPWEVNLEKGVYKLYVPSINRTEYFEVIGAEVVNVQL